MGGNISSPSLFPGSVFPVQVNLTSAPTFDAYSFNLEYNPTVIELNKTSIEQTIFWPGVKTGLTYVSTAIPGIIQAFVYGNRTVSGNGVLLYAWFKVLQTSLSNLAVTNSLLSLSGTPITHTTRGGCFNNRTPILPTVDFSKSPGPGYYDTSTYMIGKVAVGIILPESTGPHFNWTDAQVAQTVGGVEAAMNWWASQVPSANLTFHYDVHIRAPTIYEPIEMPSYQSSIWIADVMNRLGYSGDAITATLAYDNHIRAVNRTDWAFTAFVVDSDPNVNLGRFTDGQYAEALIGGPYFFMSRLSPWAFNAPNYYPAVPAHETGHIFGAVDEYVTFIGYSGYLYLPSAPGTPGLMNQNSLKPSVSTLAQVGLVDCGGNGVMDLQNTKPAIMINSTPTILTSLTTTISGKALVVPRPTDRPGGRNITIAKIAQVEYRIDQAPPLMATATDGTFDEPLESFQFNLTGLPPGTHTIAVNATTTVGNSATASFQVLVPAPQPGIAHLVKWEAKPAFRHLNLTKTNTQTLTADVEATGAATYVYVLFQITGDDGSTLGVSTQVVRLDPGQEMLLGAGWTPPVISQKYHVQATLYYSPLIIMQGSPLWTVGDTKAFSFRVST